MGGGVGGKGRQAWGYLVVSAGEKPREVRLGGV